MSDGQDLETPVMKAAKTYDIAYPDATVGIEAHEIGAEMRTLAELIADAGGIPGTARFFRPASVTYDYVPVARD